MRGRRGSVENALLRVVVRILLAMGGFDDYSMVSPQVMAYAEKHHPKYLDAPTEFVEPSLSSLENYALTEKPAPAL